MAEAERLASAYESSGLSRQEFCARNDVTLSTLSRYITRHRRQKCVTSAEPQRLVSVEVAPAWDENSPELLVVLNSGRRIEVRRGFDVGTLQQLVSVLERF